MVYFRLALYPSWKIYEMEAVLPRVGERVTVDGIRYEVTAVEHELTTNHGGVGSFKQNPLVKCGIRL